jgi:DUF2075 family protein
VHTSQGLEFDYVGVIVGDDLKFITDNDEYITEWEAYKDAKGKQGLRQNPTELNKLVRNVYRILLTRGIRGCYVYFTNREAGDYFKNRIGN